MAPPGTPAPAWKRVAAPILDFITVFAAAGYLIGLAAGDWRSGFPLLGGSWGADLRLVVIILYFYAGRRIVGGTLWDRPFGIARPQPAP
jgi:hypothetical protein